MQRPVPVWFFRSYLVFWGTRTRSSYVFIDCEQSLFFFRFSESNARARERRSAISHARGHLRVSRFARRTTEKRETARSLMFSYIQCVHPIQDYMIHSVGIITDLIVFVCLFWQIGREVLILTEEFTTLITSIGPPPGSGLGEVSSSLPPAPPLIKRRY